jgi:hypothetical protein
MANSTPSNRPPQQGSAVPPEPDPKAVRERASKTVSESNPDGFKNDPDDPTNPNEAIERSRRTLRVPPQQPPISEKK